MWLKRALCGRSSCLAAIFVLATVSGFAQQISDSALQQIAEILRYKNSFNAAEAKISSQLVFANRVAQQQPVGTIAGAVDTSVVSAQGTVAVDIQANVDSTLLGQITSLGGQVSDYSVNHGTIRATVPLNALQTIASSSSVQSIAEAEKFVHNRAAYNMIAGGGRVPFSVQRRRAILRAKLETALPLLASNGHVPPLHNLIRSSGISFFLGALTSQGYISHTANQVVNMGFNGTGVKIGVMSDSASALRVAALMTSGDLGPGTIVLPGLAGTGTDEGAAMMEIVQDIAPGAQVYFATANGGQAAMASNIGALAAAGCSIIVDDITYLSESAFQDGPIAQAVNTFVQGGGMYFSSAGNSGSETNGTSGTWEGDFQEGAVATGPILSFEGQGYFHNFGTAATPVLYDTMTATTSYISLKWSDPLGASDNDYDLFITNSTGTAVKAFSAAAQIGTQIPLETIQQGTNCGSTSAIGYCPAIGDRIYVVLFMGSPRALRLDMNRGRIAIHTDGATFGHNAAASAITMAATAWNSAHVGTRPFTGAANPVETFSSDGPRRIFFNPDGTAITPGNLLFGTGGGLTLAKPDLTAADGVSGKTPGFLPFFGTSAAAPHAAAIAALVKSANPALTGQQIRDILFNTTLDNMGAGIDRDAGHGIVMALPAVQTALQ